MLDCGLGSLLACIQLIANYHLLANNAASECSGSTSAMRQYEDVIKEYRLFNIKSTHSEAVRRCRSWGEEQQSRATGRLATVDDIPTHACVAEMIKTEGNYVPMQWRGASGFIGYFIGGTTNHTDWMWPEGSPVRLPGQKFFHEWGWHQPDQSNPGRRCMAMILNDDFYEEGTWVQQPCDEEMFFICERVILKKHYLGVS